MFFQGIRPGYKNEKVFQSLQLSDSLNAQQQPYEVDTISILQRAKMRLCKALLETRGGEPFSVMCESVFQVLWVILSVPTTQP